MQTNPPRQVPSVVSLYHPIDRAGFALGLKTPLPWVCRPLYSRTSYVVIEQYFFLEHEDLGFISG